MKWSIMHAYPPGPATFGISWQQRRLLGNKLAVLLDPEPLLALAGPHFPVATSSE